MVILFGTVTYGQADVVDKRFSVGTEFFHIFWVPLLPIGGRLVFDQAAPKKMRRRLRRELALQADAAGETDPQQEAPPDAQPEAQPDAQPDTQPDEAGDEEIRLPIPMSGKSVLLGYIRGWGFALTLLGGFLGGMLALMSGDDPEAAAMFPGFLYTAAGGLLAAMGSYYGPWNRATPARARQLCQAVGLPVDVLPEQLRQQLRDEEPTRPV